MRRELGQDPVCGGVLDPLLLHGGSDEGQRLFRPLRRGRGPQAPHQRGAAAGRRNEGQRDPQQRGRGDQSRPREGQRERIVVSLALVATRKCKRASRLNDPNGPLTATHAT